MKTTLQHIKTAYEAGLRHSDSETYWSYYTGVLQAAYNLGWTKTEIDWTVQACERLGYLPVAARSHNYASDTSEVGVSVTDCGDDHDGSRGACMFMGDRPVVKFHGVKIDRRGSDGEPLVLPVDEYEMID